MARSVAPRGLPPNDHDLSARKSPRQRPPPRYHTSVGFFDSLLGKKSSPSPRPAGYKPAPAPAARAAPAPEPDETVAAGNAAAALTGQTEVKVQHAPQPTLDLGEALVSAREHLEKKDLPAALQLYEQIVHSGVDLAEPLATISGDLGATGHIEALVEFAAPLYHPEQHGAATGLNLLQAYLHLRNDAAAQQLLDLLESLREPGLQDRLDGFRTATNRLRAERAAEALQAPPSNAANISLVTISKPIWTYGLEQGENALPTKHGRERALAFMPIALVGDGVEENHPAPVDHPLAPLARGLPLAMAEYCWYSPDYRPLAVTGVDPQKQIFLPPRAFGGEQAQGLFAGSATPVSHAVGGLIRAGAAGVVASAELTIWDVKKARAITTLRAEGPDAVAKVWTQLLTPVKHGPAPFPYAPPADPVAHAIALDHVLHFFLADKKVFPLEHLGEFAERLTALAAYAAAYPAAAVPRMIFMAALRQCTALGLEVPAEVLAAAQELERQ